MPGRMVDGYSRLACTDHLSDEKAITTIGFFARTRAFFASLGIVRLMRVITDNGADYEATTFTRAVLAAASGDQRTRPYTESQPKVERYNRINR